MATKEASRSIPAGKARQTSQANSQGGGTPFPERSIPCNIEAEEGLLASCMMDGGQDIMALCLESRVGEEYFFKPAHQLIFNAVLALYEDGSVIDEILVADKLQSQGSLEEIGGYAAITRLTSRIDTTAHARFWLEIVREKCLLRRLIRTSTESIEKCYTNQGDLEQLLEGVEQAIFKISEDRVTESAIPLKESMESAVNLIHNLLQRKGELSGVPTGFIDLDRLTFGLHAQEMIVLAARPSMGKTSLALNIAETAVLGGGSRKTPIPTLVFSLEMSAEQLAFRLLCSYSRVNMTRIREGMIRKEDEKRLAHRAKEIKDAPLWIDDSGNLTILDLRAKARRMASKAKLGLVVIDYLQLISGTDNRVPREQQIADISRSIKAMAKELNVPVLVLSQLNRESEREKRRPRLSDLRESGSIEQDADVVILLAKAPEKEDEDQVSPSREVQLIIAKQRNGPIGDIALTFIPELTRFENHTSQIT